MTGPVPGWASTAGRVHLSDGRAADSSSLADRLLCGERVARYGWAYDERDREALAACFTVDAVWEGSLLGTTPVGPITGSTRIADWLAAFWPQQPDQRRHVLTNVVLDLTGSTATAHAYLVLLSSQGGTTSVVSAGPYRFQLERQDDGAWLLSHLAAGFDAPF